MYWQEWLGKAFRDTLKVFHPWYPKLLPPVLIPAFLYLEFGMGGLASLLGIWKVAICLMEAYALAFAIIYGWKLIAAVPILLKERDDKIQFKDLEIAHLKAVAAAPRFPTRLKSVGLIYRPGSQTTFHANVEIRNISGEKTTLHDLTLSCSRGPTMVLTNPDRRHLLAATEALENGTFREGNLVFVALTAIGPPEIETLKGTQWQFTFKDVRGTRYGSNLCEFRYP